MPDTVMIPDPATTSWEDFARWLIEKVNLPSATAPQLRSTEIAQLAASLAAAQKNFAPIPKNREVTVRSQKGDYKFKYATLDGILSATVPALAEQGLSLVQTIIHDHNGNPGLETTLYHSSGEWLRNITPMFLTGRQTQDGRTLPPSNQELGSAQSYARRYGISALLCVAADEDDDGCIADGNHIENSRDVPYKGGPQGSASGGQDFRPSGPRRFQGNGNSSWGPGGKQGAIDDAERDGLIDHTRKKGELPKKAGDPTPEEERAAKIKAATDKRINELKANKTWTRGKLDKFWNDDKNWREWMADPANEALKEYERFTDAYLTAEQTLTEVA